MRIVAEGLVAAKLSGNSTRRSKRSQVSDSGQLATTGSETSDGPEVNRSCGLARLSVPFAGVAACAPPTQQKTSASRPASTVFMKVPLE
jgi:hypothetical protein